MAIVRFRKLSRVEHYRFKKEAERQREYLAGVLKQLDRSIKIAFKDFHKHSKVCIACEEPLRQYFQSEKLCEVGTGITESISALLYKKVDHFKEGSFTVQVPAEYHAVDRLIRWICHSHYGEFHLKIWDLRCFPITNATALTISPSAVAFKRYKEDRLRQTPLGPQQYLSDYSSDNSDSDYVSCDENPPVKPKFKCENNFVKCEVSEDARTINKDRPTMSFQRNQSQTQGRALPKGRPLPPLPQEE
jgi:hypothetical protein